MEVFWTEVLQFAQTLTATVGNQLINEFGQQQATQKPDGSLVTQADKWADREIGRQIAAQFPNHGILTEETEHTLPEQDWCWVVDPIDGTTNFTRGIPLWAISLGLLYQGTPIFGLVRLPQIGQVFHGFWYGDSGLTGPLGAYLNQQPIQTSLDAPSSTHLFNLCARSTAVLRNSFPCKIRMVGVASYSLLLVASGTAIGCVEATPKIWDIAAAWVIVQAAGGVFIPLEPNPIFPLQVGKDYSRRSFPCLVVSQTGSVNTFKPLVAFIGEKVLGAKSSSL